MPAGSECFSTNDCEPTTICVNNVCLPYCTNNPELPEQYQCETMCPGNVVNLTPEIWAQGVCTNVEAANACNFWDQDCEGGNICVPTLVGESCSMPTGNGMAGDACQDHTDCMAGLVCPRQVGECKPACSIEPFVTDSAGNEVLECSNPRCQGMPIENDSVIGFCP